ncbi:MAG: hypothetical protein ACREPA_07970 [Candidatus Dormibacteraceae bacterium]
MSYLAAPPPTFQTASVLSLVIPLACLALVGGWWAWTVLFRRRL